MEGKETTTCDTLKYWYVNDIGHPSHTQTSDSASKHSNKAKKNQNEIYPMLINRTKDSANSWCKQGDIGR